MNDKNTKLESVLREWGDAFTKKYEWLTVRFEFSKARGNYLVSFYPLSRIENDDKFNLEVMDFEDKLNQEYGLDAPLFCDEGSLFKLSPFAETYSNTF